MSSINEPATYCYSITLTPVDFFDTERRLSAVGIISTVAGNGSSGTSGDGGPATSALLNSPTGVFLDVLENIYIADYGNHIVRLINKTNGHISPL